MILHRIMTLGHIVSSTHIRTTLKKLLGKGDTSPDAFIEKNAVQIVREIQSASPQVLLS